MTLIKEGKCGLSTIINIERKADHKTNIEHSLMIGMKYISEALAKGDEVILRCVNDKLFINDIEYVE